MIADGSVIWDEERRLVVCWMRSKVFSVHLDVSAGDSTEMGES